MKRNFKKIITLLLTLSILFGVCSTTIAYAATDNVESGESSSTTGGIDTGWCKIDYDENGIVVTLSPKSEELLNISKTQLTDVLNTLIDAVQTLVIDKVKNQVNADYTPDLENGGVSTEGITADNVWEKAIDGYIVSQPEKYPEGKNTYVDFLKAVLKDETNTEIGAFIDYACNTLETALALKAVSVDQLPEPDTLKGKLVDMFEQKVLEYINNEIPNIADAYVKWITAQTDKLNIDAAIKSIIDTEVQNYVTPMVNAYVEAGFVAPNDASDIEKLLADYLNNEIYNEVDTYIKRYVGIVTEGTNPDGIDTLIKNKVDGWIEDLLEYWPEENPKASNPIYDAASGKIKAEIDKQLTDAMIESYIVAYFKGTLASKFEFVEDLIKEQVHKFAPDYLINYYWNHCKDANAPQWITDINEKVRTEAYNSETVKQKVYDEAFAAFKEKAAEDYPGNSFTEQELKERFEQEYDYDTAFDEAYASISTEDLRSYIDDTTFKGYIDVEIDKGVSSETYLDVWNSLDAGDKTAIIGKVKAEIEGSDFVENEAKAYLETGDNLKNAMKEVVSNTSVYEGILNEVIFEAEHNTEYVDIIKAEINERTKDAETIIVTLRTMFAKYADTTSADYDKNKYDSLVSAITAEVNNQITENRTTIIARAYENYLGMTEEAVDARVATFVTLLIADYTVLYEEAKKSLPEIDYNQIFTYLSYARINGHTVFEGAELNADAIKDVLRDLPKPSEIAKMENSEMNYKWFIEAAAKILDKEYEVSFSVEIILDSAHNTVRKLAELFTRYVSVSYSGANVSIKLNVPEKFTELLLSAASSDKVPANIKNKIFDTVSKTPGDVYALINSVTFDELMELLDSIDLQGVIDGGYLSDIDSLKDLTAEELKAKIAEYEAYYTKLLDYIKNIYTTKLPEDVKSKTLFDIYDGEGKFSYEGSKTIDAEAVLTKLSAQYGPLIASFLNEKYLSVNAKVSLSVEFERINSIEFVVGGETYKKGFLPAGANLTFFAGITEYNGKSIVGWQDTAGVVHTVMPDADAVLVAVLEDQSKPFTVTVGSDVTKVYDTNGETLTATVSGFSAETAFTYQWYKDGVAIDGATEATYTVKNVADSGVYYCAVTAAAIPTQNSNTVTVKIDPKPVDFSKYSWAPTAPFNYNGEEQGVYLKAADAADVLPAEFTYVNDESYKNVATNAGTYIAKVVVADAANLAITGLVSEFEWKILPIDYDMSGVKFINKSVAYEEGKTHSIEIMGKLPEGVTVSYEGAYTDPGVYTVTANFTGDANHNPIKPMTATLTIYGYKTSYSYSEPSGKLILEVVAAEGYKGVLETYRLNLKNVTVRYDYLESPIFGEGKVGYVGAAYDIHFVENGTAQAIGGEEYSFNVKLRLPGTLKGKTNEDGYKVVYIADDGSVVDMGATIDGTYATFTTNHFSVYAIVEVADAPKEAEGPDLTWLAIVLAILGVLIIAAVIIIIIKKRKGTEPEETNETAPEAPVDETPTEEAPAEETPVEEAPAEEAPVEETPVEEAPAEEAPAEEAPVEETPAEEAPAEEAPTEEAPVEEAPAEEAPVEEAPVKPTIILKGGEDDAEAIINGQVVHVRYRTSFMSRLIQSEAPIQDYYTVIKNKLLSYKGVKARMSWNFESFNKGRVQCAKLNVKGKNFMIYLGLDVSEYNVDKYHFTDVSDKPKLDKVPMMLKIKSERGLKYALELIEEVMSKNGIEAAAMPEVDYHMPYETTEALAARELIKIILPPGVSLDDSSVQVKVDVGELIDNANATAEKAEETPVVETPVEEAPVEEAPVEETPVEEAPAEEAPVEEAPAEEAPVEIPEEEILHVDAVEADKIVTDEQATHMIEFVDDGVYEKGSGKLFEINLDTICEAFEDGEVVTLKSLKEKKLISSKAGRVKVLARGIMTKKLKIYADKFSLQAVKMITLAGGHAEQFK